MPELPEVEQFRRLLLPLVSTTKPVKISSVQHAPPRAWPTPEQFESISDKFYCKDVIRKGKQIVMVLEQQQQQVGTTSAGKEVKQEEDEQPKQLFMLLHMGMTGRITTPAFTCRFGSEDFKVEAEYPPRYTYLTFQMGDFEAAFSDPRKFGSCELCDDQSALEVLAPDALNATETEIEHHILPRLSEQKRGIKAILLDQKRACCGVGNWVADEVLYQSGIHPDQVFLTQEQATAVFAKLQSILSAAVDCLHDDMDYPEDWLFRYRWTKKRAGKDSKGRSITFVTSGGRTSAIVAPIQKLVKSQGTKADSKSKNAKKSQGDEKTLVSAPKQERPSKKVKREPEAEDQGDSKSKSVKKSDREDKTRVSVPKQERPSKELKRDSAAEDKGTTTAPADGKPRRRSPRLITPNHG
jgi:formamidopyrimidine-DNA glycosylase